MTVEASTTPRQPDLVLDVEELVVSFGSRGSATAAVRGACLQIAAGEILGLVGESGSGKTLTGLACLNMPPAGAELEAQRLSVCGRPLLELSPAELRSLRGGTASMVFQDPLSGFHPSFSIGNQIQHSLADHGMGRQAARKRVLEVIADVGLPNPSLQARRYPHELSGGMRQRAMIALAIANKPRLLIADEPTTAVDPTVQAGLLRLLRQLADDGLAILFITHNLGVVAGLTDRIAVMYSGEVVETGSTKRVISSPRHPYTEGLLASAPRLSNTSLGGAGIPGNAPLPSQRPSGCAFHPRCKYQIATCHTAAPPVRTYGDDSVACFVSGQSGLPRVEPAVRPAAAAAVAPAASVADAVTDTVFSVEHLTRHFVSGPPWARLTVHALDDVSLVVPRGTTVGVVGESGSGKSTMARLLGLLDKPTSGRVLFEGVDIAGYTGAQLRDFRRKVQFVFQDPTASLDPRYTIGDTLGEALGAHGVREASELRRRMTELLDQVRLPERFRDRHASELSGGQRQRVAIARALAANPEVLIADEPVSSLDVSIQAQVMELLVELRSTQHLTLVMVSHDLALIRGVCDSIVTLYNGMLMEDSDARSYYENPQHPYSSALLAALPDPSVLGVLPVALAGEPPSPTSPSPGCRFNPRCERAQDLCRTEVPADVAGHEGRRLFCHFPIDGRQKEEPYVHTAGATESTGVGGRQQQR
jgi:peptide/nickel transport system ATP-binding protein